MFILAIAACPLVHAQKAIDWFMPSKEFNQSVFYTPILSGSKSGIIHNMHHVLVDDTLRTFTAIAIQGQVASIHVYHFSVQVSEIKFYREQFVGLGDSPSKDKNFIEPQVYFKLPLTKQKASWSYNQVGGDLVKCTSYYSKVNYNGTLKDCIKVDKVAYSIGGKIVDEASTSEYYLKGIGLYKVELLKSKKIFMLLDYQNYDRSARADMYGR